MRRGLLVGVGALTILVAAPATAQQVEVTLQEAVRRALDVWSQRQLLIRACIQNPFWPVILSEAKNPFRYQYL